MRATRAAVGLVIAGALLGGCGTSETGAPTGGTESSGPGPSSSEEAPGNAVPVYYGAKTGAGWRLYREFHKTHDDDAATSAVRDALSGDAAVDPDYKSLWPSGWAPRGPVKHAGGVITVDLTEPNDEGEEATKETTDLAVQQLIYTAQGALQSKDPVRILVAGKPVEHLLGFVSTAKPISRVDPTKVRSLVQIDNPMDGGTVGRSVKVSGEARVWEGNLLWRVVRGGAASGDVVQKGHTTTRSGMEFAPYSFTVTLEPGEYTLVAEESDESDGQGRAPYSDTKKITVR
ncbi:hypothetical protein GCM10023321_03030 [Pseudonocardia eucalypti]|uniref:GerMN domain-containing protein n=1 Tax=Pseudonocardia eucalypti TaxID=648755 RepID=A0ABP9PI90_9PSEU|nr:hypothetical protein [Pseudonocardia eucalypti]